MNAYISTAYQTLRNAVINRELVRCRYQGLIRECCPHTLGSSDGRPRVLMYQYGGDSSRGLPPGGEWRCMDVALITDISTTTGTWHTGNGHSRPQTCVKSVDVEVSH